MTVLSSISQQWHKAEIAELIRSRLQQEAEIRQLLAGATPLQTVCNLVTALAFSQSSWREEEWHDGIVVELFFAAFQLLFVKAIQQELSQGEELIMSISSRLEHCLTAEILDDEEKNKLRLMKNSHLKLMDVRRQRRQDSRNMR